LWKRIDDCIRDRSREVPFRGDIGYPRVVLESLPCMGESMDLPSRVDAVRPVVLGGVRNLCERGATVIGIACNTTQYFAAEVQEVCREYDAQFVSMVDATMARLRELNITAAKFLGIGAVSDLTQWSDFSRLNAQFALELPENSSVREIDDLAFLVKENGATPETLNPMRDLIRRTAPDEDDVVVLALTELSVLIATQKGSSRLIIDTLQILAERMAAIYLAERIPLELNPAP
jgi:aspartate/glutamate racemase